MFKNQVKTVVLLALLTALLLFAGNILGGRFGLFIGLAIALLMNFGAYWFSDKIVLGMYNAKQLTKEDRPLMFELVKEIASKAKIPMPKLYIIQSNNPNAFATGRNPKHATVAVTSSLLDILDKEELKGVLAHEIGHIVNRDILVTTVAATIAGVISYLATMAQWAALFGGFGGDDDGGNIFSLLILAILTPIIATILQLAISRSREYLADEKGAKLIENPNALASALRKLNHIGRHNPMNGNPTTASLFILNPFNTKGFTKLFSTHPPLEERIERLENM